MTVGTGRWRNPGRAVVALAALCLTPLMPLVPLTAAAATVIGSGTIRITGAITAPPLQVTATPAVAPVRTGTARAQAGRQGASVALRFDSAPGVVSGADVALQVVGAAQSGEAVAARFVDSAGRVAAPHDGHYRVGRDGGVLSLSSLPKRAGPPAPVIVVMSYD